VQIVSHEDGEGLKRETLLLMRSFHQLSERKSLPIIKLDIERLWIDINMNGVNMDELRQNLGMFWRRRSSCPGRRRCRRPPRRRGQALRRPTTQSDCGDRRRRRRTGNTYRPPSSQISVSGRHATWPAEAGGLERWPWWSPVCRDEQLAATSRQPWRQEVTKIDARTTCRNSRSSYSCRCRLSSDDRMFGLHKLSSSVGPVLCCSKPTSNQSVVWWTA